MSGDYKIPTHNLVVRATNASDAPFCQVGVAWPTKNGGFKIKLNAGTVIDWRMLESYALYLFPRTTPAETETAATAQGAQAA